MLVVFLLFLLSVPAQSSVQLVKAAVGGSAYITCFIPGYPLSIQWFYWQEDKTHNMLYHWDINGGTQNISGEYKDRVHLLNTEFKSGNISIRLDSVTIGDDNKTFWAFAGFYDEQKKVPKLFEQMCQSKLQVSVPYKDLHLTVNNTAKVATCTARGGYPRPRVSWTGQNKSSSAHLDAETSLQQDPTEKTFSVTSSVSVKDLQSVTCLIYNPHSNQEISKTSEADAPYENKGRGHTAAVVSSVIPVVLIIIIIIFCVWRRSTSP